MHQPHPPTAVGLVQVGRGDEDRHLFLQQLVEYPPELASRDRIDTVCRLVEEQHFWRVDQRTDQPQFLLHSAREIAGQPPPKGCRVVEGQQPVDFLASAASRLVVDVGVEIDVFDHRQIGVQPEPLAHVADAFFYSLRFADYVVAGDPGVAFAGREDRAEQPHGGRFARPVGADQSEQLPLGHVERQLVDRRERAESFRQALGSDGGHD